jgi:hypothetical protein
MLVQPTTRHQCQPPKRPRVVTHPMPGHWSGKEPGTTVPIKFNVEALPGTLWRCGQCQNWWVAYRTPNPYRYGYAPRGISWRIVATSKWALTDRKLRKRIAAALAAEQEAIVAAWPDKVTDAWIDGSAVLRPLLQPVVESPPPTPPPGGAGVSRARR